MNDVTHRTRPRALRPALVLDRLARLMSREWRILYGDTLLGPFWEIVPPLMLTGIYGFVLVDVMGSPVASAGGFLLAGLIPWLAFSSGSIRGMNALVGNLPLMRSFPVAPWNFALASTLTSLAGPGLVFFGWIGLRCAQGGEAGSPGILVLAILLLLIVTAAASIWLGLTAVGSPDVQRGWPSALRILFLLSPVLYPADHVPAPYAWITTVNPLTPAIAAFRHGLLGAATAPAPPVVTLVSWIGLATIALVAGVFFAERWRPRLAENV